MAGDQDTDGANNKENMDLLDTVGVLPDGSADFIHDKGFKMVHYNINSLVGKIDQLRFMVFSLKPDVISINETRLSTNITDDEISIENYDIYCCDRNRNGGGVCLYVKSCFNSLLRTDLMSNDLEIIWIQINLPSFKPFLVSSLYRPPSSGEHYFRNIFNNVEHALSESRDVYILSDMNIDVSSDRTCHRDDLNHI